MTSMITHRICHIEGDTKSCYQLIKTMTKFEKGTGHWLSVSLKKK